MNYQELNARTIGSRVEGGWEWGKPISHEEYAKALRGAWDVRLTPVKTGPARVVRRSERKKTVRA